MSVEDAVARDLARIAEVAPELAEGAEALTALALAAEIDGRNSATSKSMCAKALADLMAELRVLTPERKAGDQVDDLGARRAKRLEGRAVPEPVPRPA